MVWWKWVHIGISVGVSVTADGVGLENGDSVIVDGLKDGVVEAYDGKELAGDSVGDSDGAEVDGIEVVGSADGESVGDAVVGDSVGNAVGDSVGNSVGEKHSLILLNSFTYSEFSKTKPLLKATPLEFHTTQYRFGQFAKA
jgi:hypothetical protein